MQIRINDDQLAAILVDYFEAKFNSKNIYVRTEPNSGAVVMVELSAVDATEDYEDGVVEENI